MLVGLARAIYNPRPGEHTGALPDPAELCDTTQFTTPTAIQEHLFDGFIPAAYRLHPNPANRSPWTREQAERWLAFLAQHLERDRQGTTDLAWWELYRAIPARRIGFVGGLVFGLMFGLVITAFRSAFVPFVIARCWQALGRHLPWRLMSFLADAHQKRGVLRQAGAVYQFRHIDLQRRLARRPGP